MSSLEKNSPTSSPAVISIGELLVEIVRPETGQPLNDPGDFVGPYASGAPAIFAIASARLGLCTGFIGAVGFDAFGQYLVDRLTQEGINTSAIQKIPDFSTGAAFVAYADSGEREFVFHIRHAAAGQLTAGDLEPPFFSSAKWLHLSGSTLALNESARAACHRALTLTRNAGGKISLDPNLRSELMPLSEFRHVLAPYLEAADLILPTSAEAQALTGLSDDLSAARMLSNDRKAIIAVKQGPQGCTIFKDSDPIHVPGIQVNGVDPTGAGDCFSAAFITGLEAGWSLDRVGRFANTAGALAVTKMGPAEGAPTRTEIERLL